MVAFVMSSPFSNSRQYLRLPALANHLPRETRPETPDGLRVCARLAEAEHDEDIEESAAELHRRAP